MNQKDLQMINQMEKEIIKLSKKSFGKNLISLLVEGSYGTYDFVKGYSDYDLLALVKDNKKIGKINLENISKKYSLNIQCSIKSYEDLQNRIKNNNKSSRFIGNINLIKIKSQSRLLTGKNIIQSIPTLRELVKRDLGCELRADYYHATNSSPQWNIFERETKAWINYMINMSNNLLLSKGIIVNKKNIPTMLKKYCPNFQGAIYVKKALQLRKTKKVFGLNQEKRVQLKKDLNLFLEEYKKYTFY